MPSKVLEEQYVFGIGVRIQPPQQGPGLLGVKMLDAGGCPQQPCHGVEGHLGGVGFAVGREHLDAPGCGQCGDLAHQAALADPGEPTTVTTAPWPSMARCNRPSTAAISQRRPTRADSALRQDGPRSDTPNSRSGDDRLLVHP